jgi:hypothetical protein
VPEKLSSCSSVFLEEGFDQQSEQQAWKRSFGVFFFEGGAPWLSPHWPCSSSQASGNTFPLTTDTISTIHGALGWSGDFFISASLV